MASPQSLDNSEPVTVWLEQLSQNSTEAAFHLWSHFCTRLTEFAGRRLSTSNKRVYDHDDAAVSAFRSLCRGVEERRFPDLRDRESLWALLITITARKIANRRRYDHQQCRDVARHVAPDLVRATDLHMGVEQLQALEPTPEFAVEVADLSEKFFELLPEPELKQLMLLKLEGWTNEECADRMHLSRRTIQRKLERVRRIWMDWQAEAD